MNSSECALDRITEALRPDEPCAVRTNSCLIAEAADDALSCLAEVDPRKSRMVEMRFFGGLSLAETAEALNVSPSSVRRKWSIAPDWLYRELSNGRKSGRDDP